MPNDRMPNRSGWLMLAAGAFFSAMGAGVLWLTWDWPPETPGYTRLLWPFLFGVFGLVAGAYSLIRKNPSTDESPGRYPWLFKGRFNRAKGSAPSGNSQADLAATNNQHERFGIVVVVMSLIGIALATTLIVLTSREIDALPAEAIVRGGPILVTMLLTFGYGVVLIVRGRRNRRVE